MTQTWCVLPDGLTGCRCPAQVAGLIAGNDQKTVAHYRETLRSGLQGSLSDGLAMERARAIEFYGSMQIAAVQGKFKAKL